MNAILFGALLVTQNSLPARPTVPFDRKKIEGVVKAFAVPKPFAPEAYQARRLPSGGPMLVTVSATSQFQVDSATGDVLDFIDYSTGPVSGTLARTRISATVATELSRIERAINVPAGYTRTVRFTRSGRASEIAVLFRQPTRYKAYDFFNYVSYIYRADLKRVTAYHREVGVTFEGDARIPFAAAAKRASGSRYVGLGYALPENVPPAGAKHVRLCYVFEGSGRRQFVDASSGTLIKTGDLH